MDNNNPCLFCDKENQKFKLISENDFCVARFDEFPVSKGHALIIPKTRIVSFFDLKDVANPRGGIRNIIPGKGSY